MLLELERGDNRDTEEGLSWSNRQDAVVSEKEDKENLSVKNPILNGKKGINRDCKMLEKGTKIHLRVRVPDRPIDRTHTSKNSGSGSDANSVYTAESKGGEKDKVEKGGRNGRKNSTYDAPYRPKPPSVASRVRVSRIRSLIC